MLIEAVAGRSRGRGGDRARAGRPRCGGGARPALRGRPRGRDLERPRQRRVRPLAGRRHGMPAYDYTLDQTHGSARPAARARRRRRQLEPGRQRRDRRQRLQPRLRAAVELGAAVSVGEPLRRRQRALRRRLRLAASRRRRDREHALRWTARRRSHLRRRLRGRLRAQAHAARRPRVSRDDDAPRSATTRRWSTRSGSTNTLRGDRRLSWWEYWDVNPYDEADDVQRGLARRAYDGRRRLLSVAQSPTRSTPTRSAIFLAAPGTKVAGFEADTRRFFGAGDAGAAGRGRRRRCLGGRSRRPTPRATAGRAMFAIRSPLRAAPRRDR